MAVFPSYSYLLQFLVLCVTLLLGSLGSLLKQIVMWSSLVGKDIELDAVGRKFEPYLTAGCVYMPVAPLWSDLGCCSQAVVVFKAAAKTSLYCTVWSVL